MNYHSITLQKHIDSTIEVGDKVTLNDGSALSCDMVSYPVYIVNSYSELTGTLDILKNIIAEVVDINIDNKVILNNPNDGWCYLQDITVKLGKGIFRTASEFVTKV